MLSNTNKNITLYKFLKFAIVGGIGAIITWGLTWILTEQFRLWYMVSLVISTLIAMFSNYILNSIWTFKELLSMDDANYDWESYYHGNILQRYWKRTIVNHVLSMVPANESSVVDFGCGSSPLGKELKNKKYLGIDGNFAKVKYMNDKKIPNCFYICDNLTGSYNDLLSRYNDRDIVMSIEVIEHMPTMLSAEKFIKVLAGCCKVGGTVIIATPDYNSMIWKLVEFVYSKLMPTAYAGDHKSKFDEIVLINLCRSYGLQHIETKRVIGCDMVCKFVKI